MNDYEWMREYARRSELAQARGEQWLSDEDCAALGIESRRPSWRLVYQVPLAAAWAAVALPIMALVATAPAMLLALMLAGASS